MSKFARVAFLISSTKFTWCGSIKSTYCLAVNQCWWEGDDEVFSVLRRQETGDSKITNKDGSSGKGAYASLETQMPEVFNIKVDLSSVPPFFSPHLQSVAGIPCPLPWTAVLPYRIQTFWLPVPPIPLSSQLLHLVACHHTHTRPDSAWSRPLLCWPFIYGKLSPPYLEVTFFPFTQQYIFLKDLFWNT